jgi:hypothetical protein
LIKDLNSLGNWFGVGNFVLQRICIKFSLCHHLFFCPRVYILDLISESCVNLAPKIFVTYQTMMASWIKALKKHIRQRWHSDKEALTSMWQFLCGSEGVITGNYWIFLGLSTLLNFFKKTLLTWLKKRKVLQLMPTDSTHFLCFYCSLKYLPQ